MGDPTTKLVDEFRSLLEEPTVLTVCNDYDLTNPQEFESARSVLLIISHDVEAQEATGFNQSGLGANGIIDISNTPQEESGDCRNMAEGDVRSTDGFTTTTEGSQPPSYGWSHSSETSGQETPEPVRGDIFDELNEEGKVAALAEMFTSLKPIDIKLSLKKSKGNASLALDELLNTALLEQTGQRVKGINGFFRPDETEPKKRKGKKKKKKGVVRATENGNLSSANEPEDYEKTEATNQESQAREAYQQCGRSMGATVVRILDNYLDLGILPSDLQQFTGASEVARQYSWVPSQYICSIFEMTKPSGQFALDIIRMLAEYFEKPSRVKYNIPYSINASHADDGIVLQSGTTDSAKSSVGGKWTTATKPKPNGHNPPVNTEGPQRPLKDLASARDHSYTAAAASSRKGASDPLFRSVAAYFGDRAREQAKTYREAMSIEAANLVDRSSTPDKIDLHGVNVQDAVNISCEKVWQWWNSLGEDRAKKAKEGFTIVTGRGRHNADGRSRLRSSVCKALIADDWKVEVLTGSYLVTGRRR